MKQPLHITCQILLPSSICRSTEDPWFCNSEASFSLLYSHISIVVNEEANVKFLSVGSNLPTYMLTISCDEFFPIKVPVVSSCVASAC